MLKPSLHFPQFAGRSQDWRDLTNLFEDQLLVQELEKPEVVSKGGIIMSSTQTSQRESFEVERPFLAQVLMVGEGRYDEETKATLPLVTPIGAVVLIAPGAFRAMSQIGPLVSISGSRFGYVRDSAVNQRWNSIDIYNEWYKGLLG